MMMARKKLSRKEQIIEGYIDTMKDIYNGLERTK